MTNWIRKTSLVAGLLAALVAGAATAEIAVIAHPATKLPGVSTETLADIYLGKVSFLPDGSRVLPIDHRKNTEIREKFYQAVADMDERQLNSYWSKLIFTGKGRAPRSLRDDREIIEYVADNPGAIGYIEGSSLDPSVQVLLILP